MKLWTGMLDGNLQKDANILNSSIEVDQRLVFVDIKASIAHAKMLGKTAIIKKEESEKIVSALYKIYKNLEENKLSINMESEDVHTFVEEELIKEIGDLGKKLHTARSRNDQVTTDLRLFLKDEINDIISLLKNYSSSLINLANNNLDTIMPGYTHLQAAQAVSFAHHLMAYAFMNLRDMDRLKDCKKRLNQLPLGACALAGTAYDIDREYTKNLLDFDCLMQNSMDAVSDRDYVLELQSSLSIISIHLSRLCEEIIIWSSQAYNFVSLSDEFSTGSSIMPQKKNPDMAELIRSKSSRIIGNMNQSFIMMKALPLSYAKDMQEDKKSIFDSCDNIKLSLKVIDAMLKSMTINKEKMLEACQDGFLNATDLADYLVKKGLAFRDAHHIVARLVKKAIKLGLNLNQLDFKYYKEENEIFEKDLYKFLDIKNNVYQKDSLGGPSKKEVLRQISYLEEKLENF